MELLRILCFLIYCLSCLAIVPALILFIIKMVKDPVSNWQAFLIMSFSLIVSQACFHLAKNYPSVLFYYTYEQYSGSWAHYDKYIDLNQSYVLTYEFLGYLLFLALPILFRIIFRKLLDHFVPIRSLVLLIPLYFIVTVHISPSYEFVKKHKTLETRENTY